MSDAMHRGLVNADKSETPITQRRGM